MPSHLTQSKNQTLFVKGLQEPIVTSPPTQHSSPSLTAFPCILPLYPIPATLASFLFLKHAGSLLPQDVCICCFIPPRFQKGMCLYSKFQNFQKSPPQTYLDHSTKTSDPTLPHHSLSLPSSRFAFPYSPYDLNNICNVLRAGIGVAHL